MGYRLSISDPENGFKFYGTKLYGYTDERKLESYKYLESIGKVDDLTTFSGGIDNEMTLSPEQFREFIRLYKTDFFNQAGFEMNEIHEYKAIEEKSPSLLDILNPKLFGNHNFLNQNQPKENKDSNIEKEN